MTAPTLTLPPDWRHRAACGDSPEPDLWHPLDGQSPDPIALDTCHRCPVTEECLQWALDTGEPFGVWAGTTPAQRRQLRSPEPLPQCAWCTQPYARTHTWQRYCSAECAADKERHRRRVANRRKQKEMPHA